MTNEKAKELIREAHGRLICCPSWWRTPQGEAYWRKVHRKLCKFTGDNQHTSGNRYRGYSQDTEQVADLITCALDFRETR